MTIKTQFLNKNFTQNERMVIESADMDGELEVLKETEKQIFIQATSDWRTLKFWCPKSYLTENGTKQERRQRAECAACFENGVSCSSHLFLGMV